MKKILLFAITVISGSTFAQVIDTVSTGAGYANQCWYSLENDEQANLIKSDWDIAFETSGFGSSIMTNHSIGTLLWLSPTDTANWSTLDTAGMNSWTSRYNSDETWSLGAFSQDGGGLDLGWGTYSTITHFVTGDRLFVIKLSNGAYKKVWIKLLASNVYTFRYANLDNSGDTTVQLVKGDFFGKNFGYYSLQNNMELDKEPNSDDWDLMFGQYGAADQGYYNVSGVLSNSGTMVAEAYPVNDKTTYEDHANETFQTNISTIGWDWKAFNFGTFTYDIQDSLVYFVETSSGDIWKMIFTGFGGSANGNFIFSKAFLGTVGIDAPVSSILNVYPNPASEILNVTLVPNKDAMLSIIDLSGKTVYTQSISAGLATHTISVDQLNTGMYLLVVSDSDGNQSIEKVQIQ